MSSSKILSVLTASALAIPTLSSAADMPTQNSLSYVSSFYTDDAISGSQSIDGKEHDRYDIKVNQFHVMAPISEDETISFDYIHDAMSGASPWSVAPVGTTNKVIMSGASIKDTRQDTRINYTKYERFRTSGITFSNSRENDYNSYSLGGDLQLSLSDKNTVIGAGASISWDTIKPTQGIYANLLDGITKENKNTYSIYGSVTQVIDKKTLVQFGASTSFHTGYLSDAYKMNDKRPDYRFMTTTNIKLVYFFDQVDASAHLEYRYYKDSWAVRSDTIGLTMYKNLQGDYQIVPSIRYYSQDAAKFYNTNTTQASTAQYYSDDYRLTKYGAIGTGLKVIKRLSDITVYGSFERYNTNNDFALGANSKNNPGLVSYTRMSIGIEYKF